MRGSVATLCSDQASQYHETQWRERATAAHRAFIERRLSPGGCADLLAITLFLDSLETSP